MRHLVDTHLTVRQWHPTGPERGEGSCDHVRFVQEDAPRLDGR